jgi:two-component system response regulator AtoC
VAPRVLSVFAADGVATHALPATGRVTIGRAPDNAVVIDDASVSRQHAAIEMGPPIQIEDLGSANGTRVRPAAASVETLELVEAKLVVGQRWDLTVNEPFNIGSALCVIRVGSDEAIADSARARKPGSGERAELPGVIVRSAETRRVYDLAVRIAQGPINVLVLGETGSGKEVLAQTIHRQSPRAKGPFVVLDCAALSESLAESELFGHEKGAFTGAAGTKAGLFEEADGGTIFLDEVGELPLTVQVKLLRVLEDGSVRRVGATTSRPVDVRVVAATNRNLAAEVKKGAFRQDLYFRLNGMTLTLPPLRERSEELFDLVQLFAERTAKVMGSQLPEISRPAMSVLEGHTWPGNVRELRNVVERAVVLAAGGEITPEHLLIERSDATAAPWVAADGGSSSGASLKGDLDALERARIEGALETCGGNQTKAAELLGMPRRTLVARLTEYGLTRPRKK